MFRLKRVPCIRNFLLGTEYLYYYLLLKYSCEIVLYKGIGSTPGLHFMEVNWLSPRPLKSSLFVFVKDLFK